MGLNRESHKNFPGTVICLGRVMGLDTAAYRSIVMQQCSIAISAEISFAYFDPKKLIARFDVGGGWMT